MSPTLRIFIGIVVTFLMAGCGDEVGDSCGRSTDCSNDGSRYCDVTQPGGYCTVIGCEYGTCPEESICARFYAVGATNISCDPGTEDFTTDDCTLDEVCTLGGSCVPRNSEVRFCVRTCGSQGDCRSEYECRDESLMMQHGGEPVPPPGESVVDNLRSFCAPAPEEM